MIEFIFIMLGLHCLADYPLQGDFLAMNKGTNHIAMIAHCFIWTLCIYFGLWMFGLTASWQLPFLFIGHMVIDYWKCSRSGNGKELTSDLAIDQFLHIIQISICVTLI